MTRAAIAVLLCTLVFGFQIASPLALDAPDEIHIDGHPADLYMADAESPTLILWHQFDGQTGLGVPDGRESWDALLTSERGTALLSRYNILALEHPWRDGRSATRFKKQDLSSLVFALHNTLRRRGLNGEVYTLGASAGGALALLHCAMTPRVCEGAAAIGAYYRFADQDIARLALRRCYADKALLALNSPADGEASLQERIRRSPCQNIQTYAPADGQLHGMAWLYAQPDDSGVWARFDSFFGIEPPAAFELKT